MGAGAHYDLNPQYKDDEFYRVGTGIRKSGPWVLDISNLTVGNYLPKFTPVEADATTRKVVAVKNVKVVEKYTTGDAALTVKIAKESLAYVGMFIGDGTNGAEVAAIDKTNANYDVLTIKAKFSTDIALGTILFESVAVDGKVKKNTANFVTYNTVKIVDNDPVLVTLLMQAYEIKESKLILPFADADKKGLTDRFQFE